MTSAANIQHKKIPEHLEPFCQPAPSSVTKFLAAWDGLSLETILLLLEERYSNRYESDELYNKAFQSDNPYLRYIGYKYTHAHTRNKLDEKASSDLHPLVSSAKYEARGSYLNSELYDPEQFFNLSQQSRLATMRGYVAETDVNSASDPDSHYCLNSFQRYVTEIVQYALEKPLQNKIILESDLCELLKEIFLTPTKTDFRSNGLIEFSTLWKVVSTAPDHVAELLLKYLPAKGAELLAEDDIQAMRPWQRESLFLRADIQLKHLREKP